MFYTKYRPQTFSQISRPNEAADALSKQVSTGKTAHAYLFVGPRGTGKTSTARILAKALNCLNLSPNGDPCDVCVMCNAVRNGSLTDLVEIDAASNRGIDDIRDLQSKINLAPSLGKHKVYIIDEVHMLTPPAFNALLKTLEEPPAHVTFILCTTEVHKVPDTIKSRCQVFRFKRATVPQLTTKLRFITESEGHSLEESIIENIAQYSLGGFRDAETLLQQVIEGGIDTSTLLGSMKLDVLSSFVDALRNNDKEVALNIINTVYQDGVDLSVWLGDTISYLRNILLFKSGFTRDSFDMTEEVMIGFVEQSSAVSFPWLVNALDQFLTAHTKIKTSFIPQLPIEIAIVNICGLEDSLEKTTSVMDRGPVPSTSNTSSSKDTKSSSKPKETTTKSSPSKTKAITEESIRPEDIKGSPEVALSAVESKWDELLNKVKDTNGPILAMLKSAKPVDVKGKFIILEVYFAFHKERLESSKNRKILEGVLQEVFGVDLSISCVVGGDKPKKLKEREVGVLTDANVVPVDAGDIMNMLDGGLPL